ncbi:MAG: hypothetical protein LBP88_04125 [Treponema sp.]|nr:hypothetical protein [Treponema sp.]
MTGRRYRPEAPLARDPFPGKEPDLYRQPLIGCNKRVIGCNKRVIGCSKQVIGCNKRVIGCSKRLIGCNKRAIGCSKQVIGWAADPMNQRMTQPYKKSIL